MKPQKEALEGPVSADEFDTPPQYTYEGYSLYDETGEEPKEIMVGKAEVVYPVDMADGNGGYAIRLMNSRGKQKTLLVPGAKLDAGYISGEFQNFHIIVSNKAAVLKFIMRMTTLVASEQPRQEVSTIGWHADFGAFFTGDTLLTGPDTSCDEFIFQAQAGRPLRMRQKGTLEEWREHVGAHAEANPIALAFTCLSLSSVLLPLAEQGSGVFNLCGMKGTGKTVCLQIAASIWGNGCDPANSTGVPSYVTKADSSKHGLEALLPTYGVLPAILDELTERDPKGLGTLCYSLASGLGTHRMTSTGGLQESARWQLNVLMSSEKAIADMIADSGQKMQGGQADRAVDIPLPDEGIFTSLGDFDSASALCGHLKTAAGAYYGAAGLTFLEYCLDNLEFVQEALSALPDIVSNLTPSGCGDGERRVVQRFALGVIAGCLAVEAGIISRDDGCIETAFEHVRDLWWGRRAQGLSVLVGLLKSGAVSRVQCEPSMEHKSNPIVFSHNGLLTLHRDTFEKLVNNHKSVVKALDCLGILKREQGGRLLHRYCSNRFFGYSFFAKQIDEVLSTSSNDVDEAA